uniref:NADH-ubiquinone oxidoreductase chain 2 n=1 Tax=Chrysochroa fulgidissima TaxID=543396 RepID=C5H677_9COLE|nr:NADH dehydrogenase subunit 2 [Chrysochroa fulgidissima]ACF04019.1 NADH dehydrogenase subunit 2 [Chrysochroa fulgidissima]
MNKFHKTLFLMTMISGTLVAISSNSWLGMWLGLEINLLSIIPLLNNSKNMMSSEASIKYFITQAIASSILLMAAIMMILKTSMPFILQNNWMSILVLNSALLTKMGAAPFHFWFPEVMEGLSWNNSMIMLTWQKIAPMAVLMYVPKTINLITVAIMFCMLISGIMGFNQTSLRKILAYSSINHIGWMLASTIMFESLWMVYFVVYTIITLNIVLMFKSMNMFQVSQMSAVLKNNPQLKFMLSLNFLSLGGLPPFLGFMPKWLIIQELVRYNMTSIAIAMVILTILTIYFYIRLIISPLLFINTTTMIQMGKTSPSKFLMFFTNLVALMGLISCTLMFNWM